MTSSNALHLRKLEIDFNGGDPMDLSPYQNVLSIAANMGFSAEESLEAALVKNTTDNLQLITDYLLSDEPVKKKFYNKRKAELAKSVKLSPEQELRIDELKKLHREVQCSVFGQFPDGWFHWFCNFFIFSHWLVRHVLAAEQGFFVVKVSTAIAVITDH